MAILNEFRQFDKKKSIIEEYIYIYIYIYRVFSLVTDITGF